MTATIIDLRTRRPLLRRVEAATSYADAARIHAATGNPAMVDDARGELIRRVHVVGRIAGMPDNAVTLLCAQGLRRFKAGDSAACVVAWAREFARDFMRFHPGPGAA